MESLLNNCWVVLLLRGSGALRPAQTRGVLMTKISYSGQTFMLRRASTGNHKTRKRKRRTGLIAVDVLRCHIGTNYFERCTLSSSCRLPPALYFSRLVLDRFLQRPLMPALRLLFTKRLMYLALSKTPRALSYASLHPYLDPLP